MPVYEFTCNQCGREFAVLVRHVGDTAPCPECHSAEVKRRMSSFSSGAGRSGAERSAPT